MATLNKLNQRITALEQRHEGKKVINVFIRNFEDNIQVTKAECNGMIWEKLPHESHDEFEQRAANEAKSTPHNNGIRCFDLWEVD